MEHATSKHHRKPTKPLLFGIVVISMAGIGLGVIHANARAQVGGWFQVKGKVHSQGVPGGNPNLNAINSNVPAGSRLNNAIKAITSAAGDIETGLGAVNVPPFALYAYPVSPTYNARYTYENFEKRIPGNLTPLNSDPAAAPPSGAYRKNGNAGTLTITSGWNVSRNQALVIFVPGKLIIHSNITVAPGGFLAFIVKDDINIKGTARQVDGIYFTNKKICTKC